MKGNRSVIATYFTRIKEKSFTEFGLIMWFALFFAASLLFLDWKIDRDLNSDTREQWWTISFENRDSTSLDFTIDNHSENTEFSYSIVSDNMEIDSGNVSVESGARRKISPDITGSSEGRITVIATATDGTRKSVYRER